MSLPDPARGKATNVHTLTDDQLAALTRAAVEAAEQTARVNAGLYRSAEADVDGVQNAIDAMVGELHDLLDDCDQVNDPNAAVRVWAVRQTIARYRVTTEQIDDTDWAQVARDQRDMDEDTARIERAAGGGA